jgi:hypothetical protein
VLSTLVLVNKLSVRGSDGGASLVLASSEAWEAFDADCSACSLYRPTGNSGGRFGPGYWYFYPHENINASCLPSRHQQWPDRIVIKPQFSAPLRAKPVSPLSVETVAVVPQSDGWRKVATGHYAFALRSEIQGGVRLRLSPTCEKLVAAQARVLLSEQLDAAGAVRVPMATGASYFSNFSLAPGATLEHHEYHFRAIILRAESGTD